MASFILSFSILNYIITCSSAYWVAIRTINPTSILSSTMVFSIQQLNTYGAGVGALSYS